MLESKTCKRCGVTFEGDEVAAFFRANRGNDRCHAAQRRPVCIGCELESRTECKRENRPLSKARRARDHHADQYILKGLASSREDFSRRYGWDVDHMAHDIEHTSKNGCCYCRRPFAEMAHGLADISLDIVDPQAPPYYRVNVRWPCRTCNNEKRRTPPHLWAAKLAAWERRRRQLEAMRANPQDFGRLFWPPG